MPIPNVSIRHPRFAQARLLVAQQTHRVRETYRIRAASVPLPRTRDASRRSTDLSVSTGVGLGEADARGHLATGSERSGELRRLLAFARRGWSRGKRPWVAVAMAAATILVYALLRNPTFGTALWHSGGVYASLPFATELRRLPMSLFLPTPYLPEWGAVVQLLIVLGLGELLLGRWLTVMVATVGHVAATLTARVMIDVGQWSLFGLPPELARALDTGPSAAVTAVGACLLIAIRMNRCASVLCAALLLAAIVTPGVDGQEHLVALACGLLVGTMYRRLYPLEARNERTPC